MFQKLVLSIMLLLLLCNTACSQLNNKEQAKADYQTQIIKLTKAIESEPSNAKAYHDRGFAQYQLGNNQEAIADFTRAIEIKPDYSEAYYNRGRVHYSLGNSQESIEDINKSYKLDGK
ncbi:MAG: tetratricopeptide repeat protein [Cyanobacteriota bacterium]